LSGSSFLETELGSGEVMYGANSYGGGRWLFSGEIQTRTQRLPWMQDLAMV
jgi:hypothetical protein